MELQQLLFSFQFLSFFPLRSASITDCPYVRDNLLWKSLFQFDALLSYPVITSKALITICPVSLHSFSISQILFSFLSSKRWKKSVNLDRRSRLGHGLKETKPGMGSFSFSFSRAKYSCKISFLIESQQNHKMILVFTK